MCDKNEDQKENDNKPDFDIESSGVHVALEGDESKILGNQEQLNESEDK